MSGPDALSVDDLQCLKAAQENLRAAQAAMQFQVAYIRQKYQIGMQDQLHMDSGIILRKDKE